MELASPGRKPRTKSPCLGFCGDSGPQYRKVAFEQMPLLVSTSWGLSYGLLLVNLLSSFSVGHAGQIERRERLEAASKLGLTRWSLLDYLVIMCPFAELF